jgi:tubulin polyglutamylase TTLL6/13
MAHKHKSSKHISKTKAIINLGESKYSVISHVARKQLGWAVSRVEDDNWDVWWSDGAVSSEKLAKMRPY